MDIIKMPTQNWVGYCMKVYVQPRENWTLNKHDDTV